MYPSCKKVFLILMSLSFVIAACGGSGAGGDAGGSSGEIDRSSLPATAPEFEVSPMQFPNGAATDLEIFGVYNITSDCDVVHYGWDLIPNWDSYADDQVPIIAVADGIISNVILQSANLYNGQEHNTYIVWLAVASEVDVHYTFEPFITFDETYAAQWLEVSKGDAVSAGDIIGYLPKVDGNLGENLIHIDWKINTDLDEGNYVCPTNYFSDAWQEENIDIFLSKVNTTCTAACYE